MAADANAANAIPILVTSLTRRDWNKTTDSVVENLKDWVAATREVAEANKVRLVDLNAVSMKYINAIRHKNADEYNLSASDETHLNTHGETLFGNMHDGKLDCHQHFIRLGEGHLRLSGS